MRKKLSGRDIHVILIVCAVLIFGANLWYVFVPFNDAITQTRSETAALDAEIAALSEKEPKLPEYLLSVKDDSAAIAEILEKYGSNVLPEDWIKYLLDLRERYGFPVYTVNFGVPETLYSFSAKTSPDDRFPRNYVLYSVTCEFALENASYEDVKTLLTDVYAQGYRTTVNNISVEKDNANGMLQITVVLKKFFVQTYNEYIQPDIPLNGVGVDDPFKALRGGSVVQETDEEPSETEAEPPETEVGIPNE